MSTYHWIITVQDGTGGAAMLSGTTGWDADETREDLYAQIYAHAEAEFGLHEPPVLFFSLEPNQLGGVR
jgi:hypothetical protein